MSELTWLGKRHPFILVGHISHSCSFSKNVYNFILLECDYSNLITFYSWSWYLCWVVCLHMYIHTYTHYVYTYSIRICCSPIWFQWRDAIFNTKRLFLASETWSIAKFPVLMAYISVPLDWAYDTDKWQVLQSYQSPKNVQGEIIEEKRQCNIVIDSWKATVCCVAHEHVL